MGRGDCRNYYKGHMDKIGGDGGGGEGGGFSWGGVEGRGEKAYNCKWITIKIKKKKKIIKYIIIKVKTQVIKEGKAFITQFKQMYRYINNINSTRKYFHKL